MTVLCVSILLLLFQFLSGSSAFSVSPNPTLAKKPTCSLAASSTTETTTGPEIEVVRQPDKEWLTKKGVFNWGKWSCAKSKFPWEYMQTEECYLLLGQVTVTPKDGRAPATFGKGDFVTFPEGMECTWDVTEPVLKHYMFYD